jgi:hypothetical protein
MIALWLFIYFAIALSDLATDAALCFALKKRFVLWIALIAAVLWPVAMPIQIACMWVMTRKNPRWIHTKH